MSTPINFNQPSKKVILDLLNRDNNRTLTLDDVDIINPVSNPPQWPRNTMASVVAKPNRGFTGTREIHYNRLNLATYFSSTSPAIIANFLITSHDALSLINTAYNLQLAEGDIILEPIIGNSHVFKATVGSLMWTGEVEIAIVPLDDGLIDLSQDVTVNVLGGFPDPGYTPNVGFELQTVFNDFQNP